MHDLPAWCRPPDRLVGRDDAIDAAVRASREGPLTLVGPAGAGTTATGGAVLVALRERGEVERLAAVRVHGASAPPDAWRVLGLALGVDLPGDRARVLRALAAGPPTAILVDDGDLAPEVTATLANQEGPVRWVVTGRAPVLGASVEVPPLDDQTMRALLPEGADPRRWVGLPVLTGFPERPPVANPWAAVDELPPGVEILADLPMGLPGDDPRVPAFLRLPLPGRTVLRRSVREALGGGGRPTPSALGAALRDRVDALHALAVGLAPGDPWDLSLFRSAAQQVVDPELAALAAAAAARLHLRCYQPDEALRRVEHGLRRPLPSGARGLLLWVRGDVHLVRGADDEAQQAHLAAVEALRVAGATAAATVLARRCADRHARRDHAERAREWLHTARRTLEQAPDAVGSADVLRIAADLAARAGELVGAEALYDEARAALAGIPGAHRGRVAVALGRAALAAARGQYDAAAEGLDRAAAEADEDATRAPVAWRRAELALRRGHRDEAAERLTIARNAWRSLGDPGGLLLVARLEGDHAALEGDREAAVAAWRRAIELCLRTRDVGALRGVLRRWLAVEREGAPDALRDALQELADLAEVVHRIGP